MAQDSKKQKPPKLSVWCGYGLLAALVAGGAVWFSFASAEVQNRALETSLLGEARQISSAANQYMSEHDTDTVNMREIGRFIAGGPGGGKVVSVDGVNFQSGDYSRMSGSLKKGGTFYIANPRYKKSRTGRPLLLRADGGEHGLRFFVDTGAAAGPGPSPLWP